MTILACDLTAEAEAVLQACRQRGWTLATAESCTGGLIAATLTAIAGSSEIFERGFVTYTNLAKQEMLGVPEALLIEHGAVSEPVARAMAQGALTHSLANLALATTGIAGPSGATPTKPLGLVHFALAVAGGGVMHEQHVFAGDRTEVRSAAVAAGLRMVLRAVGA